MTLGTRPRPDDHVVVLFGATGDLSRRKLLPGLFNLHCAGLMPERYRVIGVSRRASALSDDEFRERAREAVEKRGMREPSGPEWEEFAAHLSFAPADVDDADELVGAVERAEVETGGEPRRIYHLAIPPAAFSGIVAMLGEKGLAERARVIVEKPFGTDLESAGELNAALHAVFGEADVFRIDHFLGKESIENILALRFANGLFEPIWNRDHVDHVQIDVPEQLTVAGRSGFYEQTGAFRDMVVTHLFQVLGFVAMEPPTSLTERAVRNETTKVFDSMKPLDPARVVRGQYEGYREEEGVDSGSETETFVALEVEIDNWRWAGVPFFLRTGKSLAQSCQVITLAFHEPPLRMFRLENESTAESSPNELVIDFQDPGSISANFLAKKPGPDIELREVAMKFDYDSAFEQRELEGYERLVHDAMLGDQTLFTRGDGIERLWRVSAPLLEEPPELETYQPGSWGPGSVDDLIAPRRWHLSTRTARV
ncbi:MAG TPA: glucose-6-phosphate dehydrogenase [Gaiellaceae bacterium]|nr:glucose-6-phosphate dehydrogenase [Gaiellaceae bacterium]